MVTICHFLSALAPYEAHATASQYHLLSSIAETSFDWLKFFLHSLASRKIAGRVSPVLTIFDIYLELTEYMYVQ